MGPRGPLRRVGVEEGGEAEDHHGRQQEPQVLVAEDHELQEGLRAGLLVGARDGDLHGHGGEPDEQQRNEQAIDLAAQEAGHRVGPADRSQGIDVTGQQREERHADVVEQQVGGPPERVVGDLEPAAPVVADDVAGDHEDDREAAQRLHREVGAWARRSGRRGGGRARGEPGRTEGGRRHGSSEPSDRGRADGACGFGCQTTLTGMIAVSERVRCVAMKGQGRVAPSRRLSSRGGPGSSSP